MSMSEELEELFRRVEILPRDAIAVLKILEAWAPLNRFDRAIVARKWPDLASALTEAEEQATHLELEFEEEA